MLDEDNIEFNCDNAFGKQLFDMKSISKETQTLFLLKRFNNESSRDCNDLKKDAIKFAQVLTAFTHLLVLFFCAKK